MPSAIHSEQSAGKVWTPTRLLGWFAVVAAGSFLLGVVLPGAMAMHSGVFYKSSTTVVVRQRHDDAARKLDEFESRQNLLKRNIEAFDTSVAANPAEAVQIANLRQKYETELRKPSPVSIQPFYLHVIMYFWPIMYFGLGSTVFILRPSLQHSKRFFTRPWLTLGMASGIFAFSTGPLLFRTLVAKTLEAGRTVYAYPNPDVDMASFIVQLFNFVLFSLLLAAIWLEWAEWGSERRTELDHRKDPDTTIDFNLMEQLSTTLLHWQVIFLAITVGFIVYTAIFWDQIILHEDYRFMFEAIDIHVVWLVTLIITATPVAFTWRAWRAHRLRIIAALFDSSDDSQAIAAKLEAIRELRPIGFWNMTASGITVAVSFAAPIIQAFIKKAA